MERHYTDDFRSYIELALRKLFGALRDYAKYRLPSLEQRAKEGFKTFVSNLNDREAFEKYHGKTDEFWETFEEFGFEGVEKLLSEIVADCLPYWKPKIVAEVIAVQRKYNNQQEEQKETPQPKKEATVKREKTPLRDFIAHLRSILESPRVVFTAEFHREYADNFDDLPKSFKIAFTNYNKYIGGNMKESKPGDSEIARQGLLSELNNLTVLPLCNDCGMIKEPDQPR